MRKVFLLVLLSVVIYSCNNTRPYELVGAQGRKPFYPEVPTGMVYVPAGGFTMGLHDQDILNLDDARAKVVTISAFYMDQTEISNNEYRQFVEWVRDSIALEHLVDRGLREQLDQYINFDQDILFSLQGEGTDEVKIANYYYDNKPLDFSKVNIDGASEDEDQVLPDQMERDGRKIYEALFADGYNEDKQSNAVSAREIKNSWLSLNWETQASYRMWDDPKLMPLLADMFYSSKERYYKQREIDVRNLVYEYYWIDFKEASKKGEIASYDSPGAYEFSESPQDASKRLNDRDGALLYQKLGDENNPTLYSAPGSRQPISNVKSDGSFTQLNDTLRASGTDTKENNVTEIGVDDRGLRDGFISGKDLDMGYMNRKMEWNAYRGHADRSRFIIHEKIPVYPDTLCWVSDLTYSNADKIMTRYFSHPAYDNYPVVGVTWKQAKAFSVWRTQLLNNFLVANGDVYLNDFRLPTEAEWERAARGDLALQSYPWGGPYIRNASGCFLGNFKPMRGRYFDYVLFWKY